jgi:hypothetical protein
MAPNLEQVGLLNIEYPYLSMPSRDDEIWASRHTALAHASPDEPSRWPPYFLISCAVSSPEGRLSGVLFPEGLCEERKRSSSLGLAKRTVREWIHAAVLYQVEGQNDYGGEFSFPAGG